LKLPKKGKIEESYVLTTVFWHVLRHWHRN